MRHNLHMNQLENTYLAHLHEGGGMAISYISDPEAIKKAIAEFDQLGLLLALHCRQFGRP